MDKKEIAFIIFLIGFGTAMHYTGYKLGEASIRNSEISVYTPSPCLEHGMNCTCSDGHYCRNKWFCSANYDGTGWTWYCQ